MSSGSLRKYILLDALYEGGRMTIGATSQAFILSKGLPISTLAELKIVQGAVMIFADVPSGVFADTFGYRLCLMLSSLIGGVGFALYFLADGMLGLAAAEVLVAISLAMWSGCYESYAIRRTGIEKDKVQMSRFFHLNKTYCQGAVMLFGLLGGILASRGLGLPMVVAATILFSCGLTLFFLFKEEVSASDLGKTWRKKFVDNLVKTGKEAVATPGILPILGALIVIQMLMQPTLHYWQALLLSRDPSLPTVSLGTIFTAYVGFSTLVSAVMAKIAPYAWSRGKGAFATAAAFFAAGALAFAWSDSLWVMIPSFCVQQAGIGVVTSMIAYRLNARVNPEVRAGVLSSASLLSRFGAMGTLGMMAWYSRTHDATTAITSFFHLSSVATVVLVGVLSLALAFRRKKIAVTQLETKTAA